MDNTWPAPPKKNAPQTFGADFGDGSSYSGTITRSKSGKTYGCSMRIIGKPPVGCFEWRMDENGELTLRVG